MGQGEKMDRLLSAVKDHVELEADTSSPSISMEVEDSPAASSHDDESKPLSKRCSPLQKHRVDVPLEDAIRAEITSYLCNVKQTMRWTKILFCYGRPMCSLNTWNESRNSSHKKCFFSSRMHVSTMGLILKGKWSKLVVVTANSISFIHDNFAFLNRVLQPTVLTKLNGDSIWSFTQSDIMICEY